MAIFTEKSAKAFEKTAGIVGAYLGWLEKAIDSLEESTKKVHLGFFKRMAVKRVIKKMRKHHKDNEKTFTTLVEELGKLSADLDERAFISRCDEVRDMVVPLYGQIRVWYKDLRKIVSLAIISTKQNKGA